MEVKDFISQHYGLNIEQVDHLEGFEDKTYRVTSSEGLFVFKQYQEDQITLSVIQAENRVLEKLSSIQGFNFPRLQHSLRKETYIIHENRICRLLSFVEGQLLGDVAHDKKLLRSLGNLLGTMDRQLEDMYEPALTGRENEWDLRQLNKNLKYLPYIEKASDRKLVRYFFLQFDEHLPPVADGLRMSLIHNDANDWNIVAHQNQVTGIFDFGDLAYTWLIGELAIGITYIMMQKDNPLQCAAEVISGYHQVFPLQEAELDILYYLVGARLSISVCNSAYGKVVKPESVYMTISEDQAWDLLRKWIGINPLAAQRSFREAAGYGWSPPHTATDLLHDRHAYLSEALSISYHSPIAMYGAAFQYMYDHEGNTFLDAYNNIMLAGHCHPHIVGEGQRMMARLNTNTRYLYDIISQYSEKLLSKFPDPLNKVFLVNSGSEASDLAIRMARHFTSREKILVLEHGYHGNTSTAMEMSHYKYASTKGSGKRDTIIEAPMPKVFGSEFPDDESCGKYYADKTRERIEPFLKHIAAFIAEPIMGCGGQVPLAKSFLKEVYAQIREQGGVCISDEVQVGFGRLGEWFWGFEMHGVVPDIVVLGKPMGNGHPIGAVITTEAIAARFEEGPEFFSSFGGNPVSCAIGNSLLDVIEEEQLQEHARHTGYHLNTLLNELQKKYPIIADVRGHGMFVGVELTDPQNNQPGTELAETIKNKLRDQFILVGTDGPHQNVLKIKPPLAFNTQDAEILSSKLDAILGSTL